MINIWKAVLLTAIFVTLSMLAIATGSKAADLGRYNDAPYSEPREDRKAEVFLRGMEIIAGAIASRRRDRNYYVYEAPTYYYDPYGTYYYDRRGAYAYGPNQYYYGRPRHHHRHYRY